MSANPQKVSNVATVTSISGTDYVLVTANAAGIPETKNITLNNLLANSNNASFKLPSRGIPTNSTSNTSIVAGEMFRAGNSSVGYALYVAVANGITHKADLSSF